MPHSQTTTIDTDTLMAFVFRAVDEVGAALNCALVVMGDRLGYYRALADDGPMTATALASATGTAEPYAREWLNAQAAGAFVTYEPSDGTYALPPEHVVALTDESSPAFLPGFFQIAHGTIRDADRILAAAPDGDGLGWHDHNTDVHDGCERFFRPGYNAHLVAEWIPAIEGLSEKLTAGARVADIGCGHGASTVLMAQAFPASRFVGSDYHAASIGTAVERAADAGVADRIDFEVAPATEFSGSGYDLVTTFDALHDMGDPVGAAKRVHEALAPDGVWLLVEPAAGDSVEDNLNPVGRAYYGFSTLLCTPASLSQPVGAALGTQAGPARIRDVTIAAGFSSFRIAASTPFNNVFEVRP
jgi:SAM-dependent methyltransferase